jgi:nucleoside phosphorylase
MTKRRTSRAITLDRTFHDVPEGEQGAEPNFPILGAKASTSRRTWPQLLEHPYVVVLGEAGTGKSTEFILQAQKLTENGKLGIFVRIDDLASEGIADAIEPEDEDRLKAWRATDEPAVLFLDSLDEAKLRRQSLKTALRKLRKELKNEWDRVRLVISCRVSDWMPESDRAAIEEVISGNAEVQVVQLAPLNDEQVEMLATRAGVEDVPEFIQAIKDHYAQVFVERPLDVEWLGGYWTRHHRIVSLSELIEDNIREKLRERPGRRSTLPATKAEAGVRALAGIATLQKKYSFLVPDETLDATRRASAVDTHDVLRDWSDEEIQELLRRPIFDESTYGRVRIHHRSVQEYLTAQWLEELVQAGMAQEKLEKLFLRGEGEDKAIPQHLGPVMAWQCFWNHTLRELLIAKAPALLIAFGDPSGFSNEERSEILRSYATFYEGREHRFEWFDKAALDRFTANRLSSPVLAATVAELLTEDNGKTELSATLLEIVAVGKIMECLNIALEKALDTELSTQIRISALRVLESIGSLEEKRQLLPLLDTTTTWQLDLAGTFIGTLFPGPLDIDGLLRVLEKLEHKPVNLWSVLDRVLTQEIPALEDVELRFKLLSAMLAFICVEDKKGNLSVQDERAWLLPMVARLLVGLLDDLPIERRSSNEILATLELFRWCQDRDMAVWHGLHEVRESVSRHPEIHRALFWHRVEQHRQKEGKVPTLSHGLPYCREMYDLNAGDISWLAEDATTREEVGDRLLAFDQLINVSRGEYEGEEWLKFLQGVSGKCPDLEKKLNEITVAPHVETPQMNEYRRKEQARKVEREKKHSENCEKLKNDIERIRSGESFEALWFFRQNAGRDPLSYSTLSVESLKEKYGEELAEAACTGWREYWKIYTPPLRTESFTNGTIIGLVGIQCDVEAGLDVTELNDKLAEKATLYALWEINKLPGWFGELAKAHPETVSQTSKSAIVGDYYLPDDGRASNGILGKLSRVEESARRACAPIIDELVRSQDPPVVSNLRYALTILVSTEGVDVTVIDDVAAERCRAALDEPKRFAAWWCAWLNHNGTEALDLLDDVLPGLSTENAYSLVEQIGHQLHEFSDIYRHLPLKVKGDPDALARLIPIMFEYISYETDIQREGAFSPGPRDNAEIVRGQLIVWLSEIPGGQTVAALRRAAEDPRAGCIRDRLLQIVEQRLVANTGLVEDDVTTTLVGLYRQHGLDAKDHLESQLGDDMKTIDIGIITMKEEEYDALLDKLEPSLEIEGKNRHYDVAELQTSQGECRVALTRVLHQGNIHAQNAANEMIADISPSFIVVAGIAGGVPTTDFCLGDVVVSSYIYDLTVEDTGPDDSSRRFDASGGHLHAEAGKLVSRLKGIERKNDNWNTDSTIGTSRPGLDGLHTTGDESWNEAISEALKNLARRDQPKSTAQKIASSDRLVKDPVLVKVWRTVLKGVSAIEMESAGVYVACQSAGVPVLAIRGISDIVGWKRDEAWTLYACRTAAAYTRMLIDAGVFCARNPQASRPSPTEKTTEEDTQETQAPIKAMVEIEPMDNSSEDRRLFMIESREKGVLRLKKLSNGEFLTIPASEISGEYEESANKWRIVLRRGKIALINSNGSQSWRFQL